MLQLTIQNNYAAERERGVVDHALTGSRYMHTHTGGRGRSPFFALIFFGTVSRARACSPFFALIFFGTVSHVRPDDSADRPQVTTLDTVTVTAAKLRSLEQ